MPSHQTSLKIEANINSETQYTVAVASMCKDDNLESVSAFVKKTVMSPPRSPEDAAMSSKKGKKNDANGLEEVAKFKDAKMD